MKSAETKNIALTLKKLRFVGTVVAVLLFICAGRAQEHQRDSLIHDADTLAWWHTTKDLSDNSMEGRDTGSAAYLRAADYVADRFRLAGLRPAGDDGRYFQSVPMHETALDVEGTSFTLIPDRGRELSLGFLQQVTITAVVDLPPEIESSLTFRGYCGKDSMRGIDGMIVVCFGTQSQGLPTAGDRVANARSGGARGILIVDDPYFTIEPPRWHRHTRVA